MSRAILHAQSTPNNFRDKVIMFSSSCVCSTDYRSLGKPKLPNTFPNTQEVILISHPVFGVRLAGMLHSNQKLLLVVRFFGFLLFSMLLQNFCSFSFGCLRRESLVGRFIPRKAS
ncbi:hypothetical protein CDAR_53771 [Caerostris darwini]|uniref:Uncharacterized protein n=1 Tax=Caerostris darwini TaxID=1538125 RepID=A0AAV4VQT0_9ARAC|nr:hypothetical protein CDAR_53771 [Caerostris darwini]